MNSETDNVDSKMSAKNHKSKQEAIAEYKQRGLDFNLAWSYEQSVFRFDDYEEFFDFWNFG